MKRECSGHGIPDVILQKKKENHKITFISEEINAWITFWNITNLLYSVQKHLSVGTVINQKPVKQFAMQNSWLVLKPSTFLVSKQT